jgi:hypothetical protein
LAITSTVLDYELKRKKSNALVARATDDLQRYFIKVETPSANTAAVTAMIGDRSREMLTIKVPFQTRPMVINGSAGSIFMSSLYIFKKIQK